MKRTIEWMDVLPQVERGDTTRRFGKDRDPRTKKRGVSQWWVDIPYSSCVQWEASIWSGFFVRGYFKQ